MTQRAEEAMWGAVDLHCHSGPNPIPRIFDHVGAAADGARLGMRAILVKSHHHNTVMDLLAMREQLDELDTKVYGGVALNSQVGGINPYVVEMSLRMGGRAVWFPTISSIRHIDHLAHGGGFPKTSIEINVERVSPLDDEGNLTSESQHVLDLVEESDALLSPGHLPPEEIRPLFEEAAKRGIERIMLSHPNNRLMNLSLDETKELLGQSVYVEHEVSTYDPGMAKPPQKDLDVLMEWITEIGPERTVLSSDLGQVGRPMPVDALVRVGQELLDRGISADDLQRMSVDNPAFLLNVG